MDEVSAKLFERACKHIPGGVNSPVRAFSSVGGKPIFIRSARGPMMVGADGRGYVDYVGSWGPMVVGHAHPQVVAAITEAAARGTSYGAPTEGEITLAEEIQDAYPHMEMSRLVSSGTEATMGALRVARGATGRDLIVKGEGGYHGGADYLLVKAGSGAATLGTPSSAGVPAAIASTTAVTPFNDLEAAKALFAERGSEIAAFIVEPVAGNMGCVPPAKGWLEGLRALCTEHGALLIFDEVMTGFRVAYGGAQERYGVTPDLTCLGKIVGGGLPVGAYGGPKKIMSHVAPLGPVYQAGTLSGNPLAVAAGRATLALLRTDEAYEKLEAIGARLEAEIVEAAQAAKVTCTVQRVGAMVTCFFREGAVTRWEDADGCNREAFGAWHGALLENGVYWPPSQFEAAFPSLAHDEESLLMTRKAMKAAFQVVAAGGWTSGG